MKSNYTTSSNIGIELAGAPGSRILKVQSPMMRGQDVLYVQKRVGAQPDGIYGPETRSKVMAFQMLNLIPATGVVDNYTWVKLHGTSPKEPSGPIDSSPGFQVTGQSSPNGSTNRKTWIILAVAAAGAGILAARMSK